jgi:hypothetical protein
MNVRKHVMKVVGAAFALTLVTGPVQAATSGDAALSDTVRQLQAEIETLRANNAAMDQKLSRMEAQSDESWLNARRAEEVKALVHEVLADADTRASLLQDGMTAGHNGKHFFLASADGSFLLELSGQIQIRYIYNDRDRGTSDLDEGEFGMTIRRTKIQFAGHIASPKLHYAVQLAVSRSDNSVSADKIVIGYDLTDDLYIWAGEDKAPFLREELTSSSRQLAVERSLINEVFTVDKAQGVGLTWSSDMFRVAGMVNDGAHSGDGDASIPSSSVYGDLLPSPGDGGAKDFADDNTDFAISGRIDVLIMGDWKQQKDFSSWSGEEMAVFLGAGLHYQVGETGSTVDDDSILVWTVDGSIEVDGLNLYVAYVGASTDLDTEIVGTREDAEPWGLVVQGGYNIPLSNGESIEPFVRWEHLDVDSPVVGSDDELDLLTLGVNYYLNGHNAKISLDGVYAFDSLPSGFSSLGLLSDATGEEDQFALRVQLQLLW